MATQLLNDDGTASMATALMMSHHAFRRDIARFAIALREVAPARIAALQGEWTGYHAALHGHHTVEDTSIFPELHKDPALTAVIDELSGHHRRMDPMLDAGDRAFAGLPATVADARALVADLNALLDTHLALEEKHVIPTLRGAKEFPPPASEAEAEMYAEGFAWSSDGVAPEVLERVYAMLPPILAPKLPAARAKFAERCERVWGRTKAGASRTSVPDWLQSST